MALVGIELETHARFRVRRAEADKFCFSCALELRLFVEFQYIYQCQNFTFVVRNFYHH